jgi:HK97 family phage portal protein
MRGLFGSLASAVDFKTTDIEALTWSVLTGGGFQSNSGVAVNLNTALKVSTVLACCRVLAEGLAQMPVKLNRIGKDGTRTPALDHPVYKLLSRRPNDWMTSFEMREMMMLHAVLTGNAYAYIGRGGGKIVELIPLIHSQVTPVQALDYGLVYNVTDMTGRVTSLDRNSVMHLRGPSWNGYLGMDALQLAREAVGLSIATEETHARLHGNGARPGGVLTTTQNLGPEQVKSIREAWELVQGGVRNAMKTAILSGDLKWTPMAMTGVDNQHIETRKHQVEEICRHLGVFPQMVMHTDKTATFASAESFFQAHVTYSLMPWVRRWEEVIERDLLNNEDGLQVKFSAAALLRGDASQRSAFYEKALGGARGETAYMTRNEVRALEDLDPIEGGDTLPQPTAPAPSAPIGGPDKTQPAPAA